MNNDDEKKNKSDSEKTGTSTLPPEIFDKEILNKVTAEIAAEESGVKRPDGWVDLPELPKPPEPVNPLFWFLRQIKRLIVLIALVVFVSWGLRSLWVGVVSKEKPDDLTGVSLPKENPKEAAEESRNAEDLQEGRRLLASSQLKNGLAKLIELAENEPQTPQGRKAMLTLAVTYRFQLQQSEDAIRWYRRYLDTDPNGKEAPATMIRLADYLVSLGRKNEARNLYEGLLKRFPDKKVYANMAEQALAKMK